MDEDAVYDSVNRQNCELGYSRDSESEMEWHCLEINMAL
jgi:hypothetical protein